MIVALIMAGGKGERFWPKSRKNIPKQFLDLTGNGTLIQQTVNRLTPIVSIDKIFVVTGNDYAELVLEQLPELPEENVIIEPMGRDTAACIGYSTLFIEEKYPDATMLVLPADHLILEEQEFLSVLKSGVEKVIASDAIVTIGINPTRPETGYGYIKVGNEDCMIGDNEVFRVEAFVEKPNVDNAKRFIKSRKYVWNSGMFIWKVKTIQGLISQYMPELRLRLNAIDEILHLKGVSLKDIEKEFIQIPRVSIDYGIMEKANDVFVIPGFFGWDDVGSWLALERVNPIDEKGNTVFGKFISLDTSNCIVDSSNQVVAALGVRDLIIVNTNDIMFICHKDRAQDIKKLLELFKMEKLETYL